MQALWHSHIEDRQYSFLPLLPPAPGAVTEPGLLEGTKGAHSISPRCTALLSRPHSQPPSASRFDSTAQITRFPAPAQNSAQHHHPMLCPSFSKPSPKPWCILQAASPAPSCCPHRGDRTPSSLRQHKRRAEGCAHSHIHQCQKKSC